MLEMLVDQGGLKEGNRKKIPISKSNLKNISKWKNINNL